MAGKHVPLKELRQIAGERNNLAHGHFDQNPYDGSYDVVTKSTRSQYSVDKINALTAMAHKAWEQMRYADGYYMFVDVTVLPQSSPSG